MVSGETPGRRKVLEPLVTQNEFPSFEAIGSMADLMFDEISRNGKIATAAVAFTDSAGRETRGEIVRVGMFNALWKKDGKVGYLEYSPAKETFSQFSVKMPGSHLSEARRFAADESPGLYLDPSSGGAFRFIADMPDWWEELQSGGSLMWPICLCGVIAAILALERFITLMRHSKATAQLAEAVTPVLQRANWDEALRLCAASTIGLARVLTTGIQHRQEQTEVLESVIEEGIQAIRGPLDRNMAGLQIIAVVSPLLGLLGTVTGMISTFNMLTIYGSGDPRLMSGGISEALVTTEYGLFISIPVILVHGYFQGKVGDIIARIEEKSMTLVNSVKKTTRQAA
jgi:biopolymer transport protein ExbB